MRNRKVLFSLVGVAALASTAWVAAAPAASGDPNQVPNVTICHRTNSVTHPYTQPTVDEDSVDGDAQNDNGQGDHLLNHLGPVFDANNPPPPPHNGDQWGDIIPPFDENGDPRPNGDNLTLNWTPAGQLIFANGCRIPGEVPGGDDPEPEPEFGSLRITKLVTGPTAGTPATYTVHVSCGESVDLNVELTPDVPVIVDEIPDDSNCTVVETPEPSNALVTYSPVGVDDEEIGVDVFADESPTEVTVTNAYADVGGEVVTDPPVAPPVVASTTVVAPAAVVAAPGFTG